MAEYCIHCMNPIEEGATVCPYCNKAADAEIPAHHLRPGTVINGKFLVGKALGEGGGTTAVAAYAVLMYASDMCQPLIYGISDSLAPAIGFNWGAESYDRVKKIAKCGYIGLGLISVVATTVMFFFAGPVASLFVDAEEIKLLELAEHALRIFSITYIVRWFSISAQSFLGAIEKPLQATILSVCVALVFPILMLGALWGFGLDGIWLNMFGTSVLALVLGMILIKCALRKHIN